MSPARVVVAALLVASGAAVFAQYSSNSTVERVYAQGTFHGAVGFFERDHARFVRDIVAITEVPAPAFGEEARAALVASMFRETRPASVERDPAGNVMVLRRGATGSGPLVVIAAHLDTVFPAGTNLTVRRDGTKLLAPGVGDNAQGVAMLVALSRAMDAAGIKTTSDVLFVADVGEEGDGDLRGVKHLFASERFKNRIRTFVSLDGVGDGSFITVRAVASRRYRVTFRGPGGHSFGSFGIVNPANAVAGAIQRLAAIRVPSSPKTTFNVGAIGGGTSVNSVPAAAWIDVDLRSEGTRELETLDRAFKVAMTEAADAENGARSLEFGRITVDIAPTGVRPGGWTSSSARLVSTTTAVWRLLNLTPELGSGSSDANWPMSLGIPAITIDTGLPGGRPHALDEWVDTDPRFTVAGFRRLLLLTLSLAGI